MSDAAVHIAREAKGLQQGLKELLKNRDITDREIDIQRKNLRRQYLRLLFLHPYARESKDAETHLWMQTSYALISIYKQRIAALDRTIHNPPRQGAQQQSSHSSRTVEYRKLLQRFRQFLAEEEKFWMQLVLRLRRYFELDEAQAALNVLGIVPEDDQAPAADSASYPRRNQHQFPPESDVGGVYTPAPTSSSQRESRMAILSKALVCLGDIARYKEQYNEAGGRPRAGHEDGPPAASTGRGGRGRRGAAPGHTPLPRLRNYDRAQSCYEQARLLLPYDGNPSHQLAILSSYQKDTLNSILHYYRALCVRSPYETASENLGTVLHKALEQYKSKGLLREIEVQEELSANGNGPIPPRLRVESFKEKVVVLHAQWCMNVDEAKSMGEKVIDEFVGLVSDRILPIEMISKIIILVEGALWKHRMVRRPANAEKRSSRLAATESNIVTHLIATHRVLLENGIVELAEAPPDDAAEGDLAQRITATFRRTLPALRMAGKWLRSNTRYLSQGLKQAANGDEAAPSTSRDTGRNRDRRQGSATITIGGIHEFWREYARFGNSLVGAFPAEKLPELRTQLEEDVDMAGFLPLRKYMTGSDGKPLGIARQTPAESPEEQQERAQGREQVHPNEEQLMRIADILADAKAVAEDEYTPVTFKDEKFVLTGTSSLGMQKSVEAEIPDCKKEVSDGMDLREELAAAGIPVPGLNTLSVADRDEDTVSVTTRTDDDPVRDAFHHVLDGSDDDEIVWQPAPISPPEDPIVPVLPTTPERPLPDPIGTNHAGITPRRTNALSPPFRAPELPRSPPTTSTPLGTTASDLLQSVIRSPGIGQHQHQRTPSAPVMNLIPGTSSIWSNERDSFPYSNGNRSLGNGSQYVPQPQPEMNHAPAVAPLPPPHGQASWSAYPWHSTLPPQTTQNHLAHASSPSRPLIGQQAPLLNNGHHRMPSESLLPPRSHSQALPPPLTSHQRYNSLSPPVSLGSAALNTAYTTGGSGIVDRLAQSAYADVFASPGPATYYSSGAAPGGGMQHPDAFHGGHIGLHAEQPFGHGFEHGAPPPPQLSRIWGNNPG